MNTSTDPKRDTVISRKFESSKKNNTYPQLKKTAMESEHCRGSCHGLRRWGGYGRARGPCGYWNNPPAMGVDFPMHPWLIRHIMSHDEFEAGQYGVFYGPAVAPPVWHGPGGCPRKGPSMAPWWHGLEGCPRKGPSMAPWWHGPGGCPRKGPSMAPWWHGLEVSPRKKLHVRLVGQQREKVDDMENAPATSHDDAAGCEHGNHKDQYGCGRRRHVASGEAEPRGRRCRGQGSRECWFEVMCIPNINPDTAQVQVEGNTIHITGPRRADEETHEAHQIHRQVLVPDDVAHRTIRTAWLGPRRRRLFIFALKKRGAVEAKKTCDGGARFMASEKDGAAEVKGCDRGHLDRHCGKGQRRECWFRVVHLPNAHRNDLTVDVEPKKIIISKHDSDEQRERADYGKGKLIQEIELPDDLAKPTINMTWLGPHRLCVFALRKANKSESLIEEAALLSTMQLAEDAMVPSGVDHQHMLVEDDEDDLVKDGKKNVLTDTRTAQQKYHSQPTCSERNEAGFQMKMDVSGYEADDISVDVDNTCLLLIGHHENNSGGEMCEYRFKRRIPLNENANVELMRVNIDQESGILHVTVPNKTQKTALMASKTHEIPIEFI